MFKCLPRITNSLVPLSLFFFYCPHCQNNKLQTGIPIRNLHIHICSRVLPVVPVPGNVICYYSYDVEWVGLAKRFAKVKKLLFCLRRNNANEMKKLLWKERQTAIEWNNNDSSQATRSPFSSDDWYEREKVFRVYLLCASGRVLLFFGRSDSVSTKVYTYCVELISETLGEGALKLNVCGSGWMLFRGRKLDYLYSSSLWNYSLRKMGRIIEHRVMYVAWARRPRCPVHRIEFFIFLRVCHIDMQWHFVNIIIRWRSGGNWYSVQFNEGKPKSSNGSINGSDLKWKLLIFITKGLLSGKTGGPPDWRWPSQHKTDDSAARSEQSWAMSSNPFTNSSQFTFISISF